MNRAAFEGRLAHLAARITAAGGRTVAWQVSPPASRDQLAAAEAALGCAMPPAMRRFLAEVCGGLDLAWSLPEAPGRPGLGVARWSVESIAFSPTLREELADAWDLTGASATDDEKPWLSALPFAFAGSDHLLLDTRAPEWPVRLFSHSFSGRLHGRQLGADLEHFLAAWLDLGFVEPVPWWPRDEAEPELASWRAWLWE